MVCDVSKKDRELRNYCKHLTKASDVFTMSVLRWRL